MQRDDSSSAQCLLVRGIEDDLRTLYGDDSVAAITSTVRALAERFKPLTASMVAPTTTTTTRFSEKDVVMIAYPDHVYDDTATISPLQQLFRWCDDNVKGHVSMIHLLPFHPSTGYDGYSISDYTAVAPELGTWQDVERFVKVGGFDLMADLVLNHCSPQHEWFRQFSNDELPGAEYFITQHQPTDEWIKQVKRARDLPLIYDREVVSPSSLGEKITRPVWATYHRELVDLNWANPDVFLEFLDLSLQLAAKGFHAIRLDAFAYVWKEKETSCVNLPQTQVLLRLLRGCYDLAGATYVSILPSITNVSQRENYRNLFCGAQFVYHLPLSALLLHTLYSGSTEVITTWLKDLEAAPAGTALLNLAASHDGVGLTWCREILSGAQMSHMVEQATKRGGIFMTRYETGISAKRVPWEIDITYWSACAPDSKTGDENNEATAKSGVEDVEDHDLHVRRFLATQSVVISLKGVPSLYLSLWVCGENDHARVKRIEESTDLDNNLCCAERAINRGRFSYQEWANKYQLPSQPQSVVMASFKRMISERRNCPAFHPDGEQLIHKVRGHDSLLVIQRVPLSNERRDSVFCVFNFSAGSSVYVLPQDAIELFGDVASTKSGPECCGICKNLLRSCDAALFPDHETSSSSYAPIDLRFGLLLKPYEVMWIARGWDDAQPEAIEFLSRKVPRILDSIPSSSSCGVAVDAVGGVSNAPLVSLVADAKSRIPIGASCTSKVDPKVELFAAVSLLPSTAASSKAEQWTYEALPVGEEDAQRALRDGCGIDLTFLHHGESIHQLQRKTAKRASGGRRMCYCFDTTLDATPEKSAQLEWKRNDVKTPSKRQTEKQEEEKEGQEENNTCPYFDAAMVDSCLSSAGVEVKRQLKAQLLDTDGAAAGASFTFAVSSPACRSLQTATACLPTPPLCQNNAVPPLYALESLRAMCSPHCHSRRHSITVLKKLFPHCDFRHVANDADVLWQSCSPCGAESRSAIDRRARVFLNELFALAASHRKERQDAPPPCVAVISHFTFLFTLLMDGRDGRVFGARAPDDTPSPIIDSRRCAALRKIQESPNELTDCALRIVLVRRRNENNAQAAAAATAAAASAAGHNGSDRFPTSFVPPPVDGSKRLAHFVLAQPATREEEGHGDAAAAGWLARRLLRTAAINELTVALDGDPGRSSKPAHHLQTTFSQFLRCVSRVVEALKVESKIDDSGALVSSSISCCSPYYAIAVAASLILDCPFVDSFDTNSVLNSSGSCLGVVEHWADVKVTDEEYRSNATISLDGLLSADKMQEPAEISHLEGLWRHTSKPPTKKQGKAASSSSRWQLCLRNSKDTLTAAEAKALCCDNNKLGDTALTAGSRVVPSCEFNTSAGVCFINSVGVLLFGGCVAVKLQQCNPPPPTLPPASSSSSRHPSSLAEEAERAKATALVVTPAAAWDLLLAMRTAVDRKEQQRAAFARASAACGRLPGVPSGGSARHPLLPKLAVIVIVEPRAEVDCVQWHHELSRSLHELLHPSCKVRVVLQQQQQQEQQQQQHGQEPVEGGEDLLGCQPLLSVAEALRFLKTGLGGVVPEGWTAQHLAQHVAPRNNRVAFVTKVCEAFERRIPFQTFLMVKADGLPPLHEIKRDVLSSLGGCCFVLNAFLRALFSACGFATIMARCSIHSANVAMHPTVILQSLVEDGDLWFVDVGSGNRNVCRPVRLSFQGNESAIERFDGWQMKHVRMLPDEDDKGDEKTTRLQRWHKDTNDEAHQQPFDHLFWEMSLRPHPTYDAPGSPFDRAFAEYRKLRAVAPSLCLSSSSSSTSSAGKEVRYFKAESLPCLDSSTGKQKEKLVAKVLGGQSATALKDVTREELAAELCRSFPQFSRATIVDVLSLI